MPASADDSLTTSGSRYTDSKGWDGKLRVGKKAVLVNPEALSDPEYSDEDAPPIEQIEADEGMLFGKFVVADAHQFSQTCLMIASSIVMYIQSTLM